VDDGTETHFTVGDGTPAYVKAVSSGKRKLGIVHSLFINGEEVPPSHD
jgi:Fas apoptotic inhibitory molecule (FAIM1)